MISTARTTGKSNIPYNIKYTMKESPQPYSIRRLRNTNDSGAQAYTQKFLGSNIKILQDKKRERRE
jgi:hypothetical protein